MNERWYPGSLSPEVTEMELEHRRIARRAAAEGQGAEMDLFRLSSVFHDMSSARPSRGAVID